MKVCSIGVVICCLSTRIKLFYLHKAHLEVWVCCQIMPIIIESRQQQSMGSRITQPSASSVASLPCIH